MERLISLYQITDDLAGLNQTIRKFLRRNDTVTVDTKILSYSGFSITATLESASNDDPGKPEFLVLRLKFEYMGGEVTFITHPYISANFSGQINKIYEELKDGAIGELKDKVVLRPATDVADLKFAMDVINGFESAETPEESKPGFDRAVPRAEHERTNRTDRRERRYHTRDEHRRNNAEDTSGYRERFGHRNSEDHRRNIITSKDVAGMLLKSILGPSATRSFFRDNEVVGEVETQGAKFERTSGGQVITLVVQIKVEDI